MKSYQRRMFLSRKFFYCFIEVQFDYDIIIISSNFVSLFNFFFFEIYWVARVPCPSCIRACPCARHRHAPSFNATDNYPV